MELELSQVLDIDTAGIQLLGLLKREAMDRDISLEFKNHSTTVQDAFTLYHVTEQLEQTSTDP
ncbi:MAG TPA: STAS domain-containing protein [Gammaproteobacteria bacterium]|nr:STAS domain-containing protein [Gammaproteobacteria bacterium]